MYSQFEHEHATPHGTHLPGLLGDSNGQLVRRKRAGGKLHERVLLHQEEQEPGESKNKYGEQDVTPQFTVVVEFAVCAYFYAVL